jgi:hypothetical protein
MGSAYTFELSGTGDLDHGHTRPYIDKEVRVNVRSGLGKLHRFGIGITVSEHLVGNFGDEEIEAWLREKKIMRLDELPRACPFPVVRAPTDDQAFHLLLSQNIDVQRLLQLVVELECAPSRSNDTQFIGYRAIAFLMFLLQLTDEVDADVDSVGFEVDEIEATTVVSGVQLSRKVYQFSQ